MLQCPSALFLILLIREKIDQMWVCHPLHSISLWQGLRQCLFTYCPRLLGAKEPGKLEPFLLFWLMPELTALSESSFSICLKTWRLCAPRVHWKLDLGFHLLTFSDFPYPHTYIVEPPRSPALPSLPTRWSSKNNPSHTHQSGATRWPRIFVPRSLLDTQGWSFRRGTTLSVQRVIREGSQGFWENTKGFEIPGAAAQYLGTKNLGISSGYMSKFEKFIIYIEFLKYASPWP